MKTSFANAFKDLSEDKVSEDRIFKTRATIRNIKNEKGTDVSKEQVLVIEPYNPEYKSAKISTLLVNKTLKEKYDKIYEEIDERKEALIKELKPSSGLNNSLEEVFANDFTHDPKEFFTSLMRVQQ